MYKENHMKAFKVIRNRNDTQKENNAGSQKV